MLLLLQSLLSHRRPGKPAVPTSFRCRRSQSEKAAEGHCTPGNWMTCADAVHGCVRCLAQHCLALWSPAGIEGISLVMQVTAATVNAGLRLAAAQPSRAAGWAGALVPSAAVPFQQPPARALGCT